MSLQSCPPSAFFHSLELRSPWVVEPWTKTEWEATALNLWRMETEERVMFHAWLPQVLWWSIRHHIESKKGIITLRLKENKQCKLTKEEFISSLPLGIKMWQEQNSCLFWWSQANFGQYATSDCFILVKSWHLSPVPANQEAANSWQVSKERQKMHCVFLVCALQLWCSDIYTCLYLTSGFKWLGIMTEFFILSMVLKHKHTQNYGACKIPSINCDNPNIFFLS